MALPLPYAPNIDATAERLRSVRAEAARPPVDVGAGVADAITTGMTLASALEAGKKKDAAEIFQREFLSGANEDFDKIYAAAGKPEGFNPEAYKLPPGTPPDKVRETKLLFIKDLTGAREKVEGKANVTEFAEITTKGVKQEDGTYRPATEAERAAAEIKARGADGVKSVQDRADTEKRDKAKGDVAENIAKIRAKATKSAAGIREALSKAKDAGVVAAIERENERLQDIEAEIEAAEKNPDMSAGALRRLTDRLTRESSAINTRISSYITKVSDVSKIPDTIKKPGAGGATTDASKEVENARAAITMGAPKVAVFDLYFKNNGSRHPDDTRK